MKRFLVALPLMLAILLPAFANELKTEKVKLPTLQCGMCKKTIEKKLKGLEGLESITVDVAEKEATVVYDETKITIAQIEEAISKTGYAANETAADADAQSKLHGCCRPGAHDGH